ncbi:MAG: hypothetical protein QXL98_01470, partial [Thermofilaceae archaeon]
MSGFKGEEESSSKVVEPERTSAAAMPRRLAPAMSVSILSPTTSVLEGSKRFSSKTISNIVEEGFPITTSGFLPEALSKAATI